MQSLATNQLTLPQIYALLSINFSYSIRFEKESSTNVYTCSWLLFDFRIRSINKTSFDLAEARCKNYYQMFSNYSSVVPSGIPWNIGLISFKTYIALLSITNPVKFALVFCIEQLNSNYNDKCICYIAGLSLNKISAAIGWFLVTCPWSNSNVFRPRYNCAVVARARSLYLFVFATWLLKERSKYITKHLTYGP